MSLKPDGKAWIVREQIIDDPVSELSFQFEVMPSGEPRFRVFGPALPFGNRELIFSNDGRFDGGGTYAAAVCKPAWMQSVDSLTG